ncbi:DNA primase [Candidatus Babeliales bacterium]|nr:DNA primase [Candidatus Babeliales bacterium]MBY0353874.1 DNA primase [Candidatus Babeliales bacterium]
MALFNFIKNSLPIIDVVGDYVQLRPAGSYWKGSCPFHSETDASFTVSPAKQIFYCFGCQATGDVIAFMARLENISQFEAAKYLVDRHKITIPAEVLAASSTTQETQVVDSYFHLCASIAEWAHQRLVNNKTSQEYLLNRGITIEQINSFTLGYFPSGVAAINQFTKDMASQNILVKDLLEYGFLGEGRTCLYSPFEERIIFPIKDHIGRFCGFGGRIFKPNDERPKYYNSRESEGFAKGKLLFGLDLAKKDMQKQESAFLVEGYMDCITMVGHGYVNTVATLGTACTLDHLKLLARYVTRIYFLYDGDKAGKKAMLRTAQFCWEANLDLHVILLPANQDPASYLSEGGDLGVLVSQAQDIFTFFVKSVSEDFAAQPLATKLKVAHRITEVIATINDPFKQDLLLQQASQAMFMPFQSLRDLMKQRGEKAAINAEFRHHEAKKQVVVVEQPQDLDQREISLLEEKIFSGILNSIGKNPPLTIDPLLLPYFSPRIKRVLEKFEHFSSQNDGAGDKAFLAFVDTLDPSDVDWVTRISILFDKDIAREVFDQLLLRFCKYHWKQIVRDIKLNIVIAKERQDSIKLNELLNKFLVLKQGINDRGLV